MSSTISRSPAARTRPCACPRCATTRSTGRHPTCSSSAAASRACRSRVSSRARSSTFSWWIRSATSRSAPRGATTARCTRASTSGAAASSINISAAETPCTIRSVKNSTCRFPAWGSMSASSTAGCARPCGATACGANIMTASPTPSSSPAGSCCAASRTSMKKTRFAISNPDSGCVCPYGLTIAYAENAVQNGARIALNTAVLGMDVADGRITAVHTNRGTLHPARHQRGRRVCRGRGAHGRRPLFSPSTPAAARTASSTARPVRSCTRSRP